VPVGFITDHAASPSSHHSIGPVIFSAHRSFILPFRRSHISPGKVRTLPAVVISFSHSIFSLPLSARLSRPAAITGFITLTGNRKEYSRLIQA